MHGKHAGGRWLSVPFPNARPLVPASILTMKTDSEKAEAERTAKVMAVRNFARQANGAYEFYKHPLTKLMIYTNGVAFVAETCGAHWLIDAIASHIATNKAVRAEEFQTWELRPGVAMRDAVIVCTNGNDETPVCRQVIAYTDFPRELLPFRLFAEYGMVSAELGATHGFTLMLPEER